MEDVEGFRRTAKGARYSDSELRAKSCNATNGYEEPEVDLMEYVRRDKLQELIEGAVHSALLLQRRAMRDGADCQQDAISPAHSEGEAIEDRGLQEVPPAAVPEGAIDQEPEADRHEPQPAVDAIPSPSQHPSAASQGFAEAAAEQQTAAEGED
ncbi:hypothetical protein Aduo_006901 [Ancylostoma duodenale]